MGASRQIQVKEPGNVEESAADTELRAKANWVRKETLRLHKVAPETRVASSLSPVEIFTALYYGGVLTFDAKVRFSPRRDRFVISKGHGAISMYPILADLGFFDKNELDRICHEGSFLGGIPDPIVPGFETVNGSLGHGLGVACGIAVALKRTGSAAQVFALAGDGEMNEGSIWEAVMFAAHHGLDNLNLIVDQNKKCMLDVTVNVINMDPLDVKFKAFGFDAVNVDGHDVVTVRDALFAMKTKRGGQPKVLIAETVKGKGAVKLESTPLCHITALNVNEVDEAIARLK